jgi:ParB-like chromosome segregation protein Spo0J
MKTFREFVSENRLSIDKIHDGQGILDHDQVAHYKKKIEKGEAVKPIIVRPLSKKETKKFGGKTHYIYDGAHRYHAHKQAGHKHIETKVAYSDDEAEAHQIGQQ